MDFRLLPGISRNLLVAEHIYIFIYIYMYVKMYFHTCYLIR